MNRVAGLILRCLLVLFSFQAWGQFNAGKVCRLDEGRLVFTLDKRWNADQRKEVARLYALDSLLMARAFMAVPVIEDSGTTWRTRKLDANLIELSKEQGVRSPDPSPDEMLFLLDDDYIRIAAALERNSAVYGVNRLTRNTIVQLQNNRMKFFLPGRTEARQVYLSGSFNAWSTRQTPMQRSDSGWHVTITLNPGKYSYKFIIDGKWINDPYNRSREDDLNGGFNSIFFCYNHQFTLNGFPKARKIKLTGSFNHWNPDELTMIRFKNRWVLNMYLKEGTHAYKYIVDGEWMNDPGNKVKRPDGQGNQNSYVSIGDTIFFQLSGYSDANKVTLAGTFNGWNPDELYMKRVTGGWELPYVLAPGNYEYKFIVDGKWMPDPDNPYTDGSGNYTNSFMAYKPNYSFRLEEYPDAKEVLVTGSFNGWSKTGYRMVKKKGVWSFPIHLDPGKYTYKFIVDKKYILDPGNGLWEENEYGTGNSVIWINPL